MSRTVVRELERYGRFVDALAPPIDLAEVVSGAADPVAEKSLRRQELWPRRLAVAAAASVVTVVLVGGAAFLGLFDSPVEVADPTVTTAAIAPDEDPGPFLLPDSEPVEGLVWDQVEDADFDVPGRLDGVIRVEGGWLAVGSVEGEASGTTVPAVWVSEDGVDWALAGMAGLDGVPATATGIAQHTGRILVTGYQPGSDAAGVWYSDGGTDWVNVDLPTSASDSTRVHAVGVPVSYAGFVAVGTDAWFSADGKSWTRNELEGGEAFALAVFDSGVIAAGQSDETGQAAVWVSVDIASTWQQADVESRSDLFDSSAIYEIAKTDEGFVAVGHVVEGGVARPSAWSSADADSWDLLWVGLDASGSLRSVTQSGEELVAVGIDPSGLPTGIVWQSADHGVTWVEHVDRAAAFMTAAAPGVELHAVHSGEGRAVLAVGVKDGFPAVWMGIPAAEIPDPLDGWTCEARIDNGAVWSLGSWDATAGVYVAESPLACLDLLDMHREPQQWKVVWKGAASTLEIGLLLVFEEGIHGDVYAEFEAGTESGEWITPLVAPGPGPFTFVVMPHSFDTWEHVTFTVTPCSLTECG